jgi:hypothetical protein
LALSCAEASSRVESSRQTRTDGRSVIDRVSPPTTTTTKGSDVGVGSNSTEFQSTRVGVGVGGCIFINIIICVRMPTLFRARHERDGRRRATGVDARGGRKG